MTDRRAVWLYTEELSESGIGVTCGVQHCRLLLAAPAGGTIVRALWSSEQVTFHRFLSSRLKISRVVPNTNERPGAGAV